MLATGLPGKSLKPFFKRNLMQKSNLQSRSKYCVWLDITICSHKHTSHFPQLIIRCSNSFLLHSDAGTPAPSISASLMLQAVVLSRDYPVCTLSPSTGHLLGNVWRQLWSLQQWGSTTGIRQAEARDAAEPPSVNETGSHT